MKILGIVAEYNPFHLGHKYHLEMAKKASKCDAAAIVMSGNYVQRGEPAIIDKHMRAEIAVNNGADLVIELPVPFSCQNAEIFALGAVKELKKLGVSAISFGCENTDINLLHKIADIQLSDSTEYSNILKKYISGGFSYPAAVDQTVKQLLNEYTASDEMILSPNNTLGLEYIKASRKINFDVEFIPIKRHVAQHNDKSIKHKYSSATAIRNELLSLRADKAKISLPKNSYACIKDYYNKTKLFNSLDKYLDYIYYKVIISSKEYIKAIYDVSEGLENKIYDNIYKHKNLDDFIMSIKSKRYTYSRIRRILLNILLDITKEDMCCILDNDTSYIKVLAFNSNGKAILSSAKDKTSIITKYSDYKRNNINTANDIIFKLESKSTNIYYLPFKSKDICFNSEYKKSASYIK